MAKPFLRWAGSKRQLLPHLAAFYSSGAERYVEPFVGSACLFFHLEPTQALLGDINAELIEMYQVVRDRPGALHRVLNEWSNDREEYYRVRAMDPRRLSQTKRAGRFVYLNRYCFNGLYRTNRKGQFNVPYGGAKTGGVPDLSELRQSARLLSRAELVAGDFNAVLRQVKRGDFVYLDPPFSVLGRRVFKEYDRTSFAEPDLVRLKRALRDIHTRGAMFLLSYADSSEGEELAEGYAVTRLTTRRNIAGFVGNRRSATELLATNISPVA